MSYDPMLVLGSDEGWHWMNMDEIDRLRKFGKSSSEIQIVHGICYNSLLSAGAMTIMPEGSANESGDGTTLVMPNEQEEAAINERSAIWSAWGRDGALEEDYIGFFLSTGIRFENDEMRPIVMNTDRMRILHSLDVYGQHSWRFFEILNALSIKINSKEQYNGLRELYGIKVIGTSLPDTYGNISSRVKRIRDGEYAMYENKKRTTMSADNDRANPMYVTQSSNDNHDPNSIAASSHAFYDQTVPEARQSRSDTEFHAMIRSHNTCGIRGNEGVNAVVATSSNPHGHRQFELDAGRVYVNAHVPEAPVDLAIVRQAFLEMVCLAWGIPMSMISNGDTSGKAKLNTPGAAPESARIFREAQSDRKTRMECNVREMYQHIHQQEHAAAFLKRQVLKKYKRLKAEGKKHPDYDDLIEDPNEDMGIAAIERSSRMIVHIPSSGTRQDMIDLLDKGIMKYSVFCEYNSKQMGLTLHAYNKKQSMTDDAMQINGCAPKETTKTTTTTPKKKKQKTK